MIRLDSIVPHGGHLSGANPCFFCGREITPGNEGGYVHLGAYGDILLAKGEDDPDSLGLFPVGRECIKKVPDGYCFEAEEA